jgi:hypothetical protein
MCAQHKKSLIIAYSLDNLEQLCDECISKKHLDQNVFRIYPQVVFGLKQKIDSVNYLLKSKKMQLKKASNYMRDQHN